MPVPAVNAVCTLRLHLHGQWRRDPSAIRRFAAHAAVGIAGRLNLPMGPTMIQRRHFLQATTLAAGALPQFAFAAGSRPRVGVVGAGIIGASVAAYLVDAGADVVIFEKEAPASGATRASLAWINPSTANTHYRDLRLHSMAEWLRMQERMQLDVIWGGSVSWTDDDKKAETLNKREEVLRGTAANPSHLTQRDIAELCPYIAPGETKAGFFLPHDGHIDPVATTQKILAYATAKGARLLYPCFVDEVLREGGQVKGVQTSHGEFHLDHLVSACGTDTTALLAKVGVKIDMNAVPGLKIHTHPIAHATKMVYDFSSALEFKQMPNGEAVAIYVGGPPKTSTHAPVFAGTLKSHPTQELAAMHGESLKAKVAHYWPALQDARVKEVVVGFRPIPKDGLPMVGHVPGVAGMYMVATHSGVTLAPILGKYTAQEILGNERVAMLEKYRPQRFL